MGIDQIFQETPEVYNKENEEKDEMENPYADAPVEEPPQKKKIKFFESPVGKRSNVHRNSLDDTLGSPQKTKDSVKLPSIYDKNFDPFANQNNKFFYESGIYEANNERVNSYYSKPIFNKILIESSRGICE